MTRPNNADLASGLAPEPEMAHLITMIRGFDYEEATSGENLELAQALKLVAVDVVSRHGRVVAMQQELSGKLAVADTTIELAGVIKALRPAARRWFNLGK